MKLNIQEYYTKNRKLRYILRGHYIGINPETGKPVKTDIRGDSKGEIRRKLDQLQTTFKKNGRLKKVESFENFAGLAESWFSNFKVSVKPRTVEIMRGRLDIYILPAFGDKIISAITPVMVQEQVNKWAFNAAQPVGDNIIYEGSRHRARGKGASYKIYFNIVNRIFKYAVSLGLAESNPCLNVVVPKMRLESTERETKYFNQKQLKTFFGYQGELSKEPYTTELLRAVCRLLVASGMRIGETMALTWSDIDFDSGKITLSEKITKTSKKRVVIIDRKTLNCLESWHLKERQHFLKLRRPNIKLIFPTKTGKEMDYQTLRPFLLKWFEACDLPNIGFHGFRHTHASLLLNAGVSYKEIQARLGHASIKMTMDIYSHLEDEKQGQAVQIYENISNF